MSINGEVFQTPVESGGGLVRFDTAQPSITPAQQAQARANIGVVTAGGVALAGNGGDLPGFGYTGASIAGDCTIIIHHTLGAYGSSFVSGGGEFSLSYGQPGFGGGQYGFSLLYGGNYYSAPAETAAWTPGKRVMLEFKRTSGRWSVASNGATPTEIVSAPTTTVAVDRILGGLSGGYGQSNGSVPQMLIVNRPPTDDERAAVMRGEVPAALAKAGVSISNPNATLSCWGPATSANATDFTVAGADPGYPTYVGFGLARSVSVGEVYRIQFFTPNPPAGGMYINGAIFNDGSFGSNYGPAVAAVHDGGNRWHADVVITAAGASSLFTLQLGWAGTVSQAFTGFSVTRIGTIARYEPENVTSLGRWIDSSGNGYDLIPGSGITPLKPQPPCLRSVSIGIDGFGSSFTNLPAGWSASKIGAGDYRLTCPAYINNATAQGVHGALLVAPGTIAGEFFPGANSFGVYAFGTADTKADAYARVTPHWTE